MSDPVAATAQVAHPASVARELALIWRDLFGLSDDQLGADADFFELGGTSLTAIKLLSRVESIYGDEALLPDTLFATPQLGALAGAISATLAARARG